MIKSSIPQDILNAFSGYIHCMQQDHILAYLIDYNHKPVLLGSLSKITDFLEDRDDNHSLSLLELIKSREKVNCEVSANDSLLKSMSEVTALCIISYIRSHNLPINSLNQVKEKYSSVMTDVNKELNDIEDNLKGIVQRISSLRD